MLKKQMLPPFIFVLVLSFSTAWSAPAQREVLTITAVGDIMMGTTYPTPILPPQDGQGLFSRVHDKLKGSDIVFGNLEAPFIDEGTAHKCKDESDPDVCYEFRMPTRYVRYLVESGFNVVNIANNHAFDFGTEGVRSTLKTLKDAGIRVAGGKRMARFHLKNRKVIMAGFSAGSAHSASITNIAEAAQIVRSLKSGNDIVIVSFHGGAEGKEALHVTDADEKFAGEKRGNVVKFARAVIDAGADMVIGHGPHVVRALEVYKGKLIAYSLGNFLTYGSFNISGPNGLSVILKANIDCVTGNFVSGRILPVRLLEGGIPFIDSKGESIRLIKELTGKDFVKSTLVVAENGDLSPASPQKTSRFRILIDYLKRLSSPVSNKP